MEWFGIRGGSRTAATSKMERFVIIVNGFQPLTIITMHSILDVAAVLDPPLEMFKIYCLACFMTMEQQVINIFKRLVQTRNKLKQLQQELKNLMSDIPFS